MSGKYIFLYLRIAHPQAYILTGSLVTCLSRLPAGCLWDVPSQYPMESPGLWSRTRGDPFLHPIQPLAHEGLAEQILLDIDKMPSPVEHRKCCSGVVLQQFPGVTVAAEMILAASQQERGELGGGGMSRRLKGSRTSRLQLRVEGVVGKHHLGEHLAHRLGHGGRLHHHEIGGRS